MLIILLIYPRSLHLPLLMTILCLRVVSRSAAYQLTLVFFCIVFLCFKFGHTRNSVLKLPRIILHMITIVYINWISILFICCILQYCCISTDLRKFIIATFDSSSPGKRSNTLSQLRI